jgi:type IV secretory pathway protease TraF
MTTAIAAMLRAEEKHSAMSSPEMLVMTTSTHSEYDARYVRKMTQCE